jgi:hypothetical protein
MRILLQQADIKVQLRLLQQHITEHDVPLCRIYDSMENLPDDKAAQFKWKNRVRIDLREPLKTQISRLATDIKTEFTIVNEYFIEGA